MFSRREVLAKIAAAALVGPIGLDAAQPVHATVGDDAAADGGVYRPKALNQHEYGTLRRLCELIVPGASKGGAAEFIDLLSSQNPDLLTIYTGGLAWIDFAMKREYAASFLAAATEQQTAMLDKIAYRRNRTPELAAGIRFFDWVRQMTVDAYYTSAAGIKELGYLGNTAVVNFKVPQEAIELALKKSGLG